jgi:hypothetical protein
MKGAHAPAELLLRLERAHVYGSPLILLERLLPGLALAALLASSRLLPCLALALLLPLLAGRLGAGLLPSSGLLPGLLRRIQKRLLPRLTGLTGLLTGLSHLLSPGH